MNSRRNQEGREAEPDTRDGRSKEKGRDLNLEDERQSIGLHRAEDDLFEGVASRGELGSAEDEVVGQGDGDENVGHAVMAPGEEAKRRRWRRKSE